MGLGDKCSVWEQTRENSSRFPFSGNPGKNANWNQFHEDAKLNQPLDMRPPLVVISRTHPPLRSSSLWLQGAEVLGYEDASLSEEAVGTEMAAILAVT